MGNSFEPVGDSTERMYGPPMALVCGHSPEEKAAFLDMLKQMGAEKLHVVFPTALEADRTLLEIAYMPKYSGKDSPADLIRTVILSGLVEKTCMCWSTTTKLWICQLPSGALLPLRISNGHWGTCLQGCPRNTKNTKTSGKRPLQIKHQIRRRREKFKKHYAEIFCFDSRPDNELSDAPQGGRVSNRYRRLSADEL